MLRHLTLDFHYDASPRRLAELMTDEEFLVAEVLMQGTFEAHVEYLERTPERVHLLLHQRSPNRNPLSRAKDSRFAVRYRWELGENPRATWAMEPEADEPYSLAGSHAVDPDGTGGSRYRMTWDYELKIRLGERAMAKAFEAGLKSGMRKREAFLRDWLAKTTST